MSLGLKHKHIYKNKYVTEREQDTVMGNKIWMYVSATPGDVLMTHSLATLTTRLVELMILQLDELKEGAMQSKIIG